MKTEHISRYSLRVRRYAKSLVTLDDINHFNVEDIKDYNLESDYPRDYDSASHIAQRALIPEGKVP